MAAPEGNQFARKLTSPELKAEAYRQYCTHIAGGASKDSFVFDHPEIQLTSRTMEKYICEEPEDFPSIHKEIAEAKSLAHWEKIGKGLLVGEIKGGQPAIFQMFIKHPVKFYLIKPLISTELVAKLPVTAKWPF